MNDSRSKDPRPKRCKQAQPAAVLNADTARGEALRLRKDEGLSYAKIARELGVSKTMAFRYVNDGWAALCEENDEERKVLRSMEDEDLDTMEDRVRPVVEADHLTVIDEQMGLKGPTEVRLAPLDAQLKAIDRWLKVKKRRAELHGYDAPTKIEDVTPKSQLISLEELERKILEREARKTPEQRRREFEAQERKIAAFLAEEQAKKGKSPGQQATPAAGGLTRRLGMVTV